MLLLVGPAPSIGIIGKRRILVSRSRRVRVESLRLRLLLRWWTRVRLPAGSWRWQCASRTRLAWRTTTWRKGLSKCAVERRAWRHTAWHSRDRNEGGRRRGAHWLENTLVAGFLAIGTDTIVGSISTASNLQGVNVSEQQKIEIGGASRTLRLLQ